MPGWLIVEDTKTGSVEVLNINNIVSFDFWKNKRTGKFVLDIYTIDPAYEGKAFAWRKVEIPDSTEFEKLINALPAIDNLGWILVRDGKVDAWRGSLAVKEVKELTEEEEEAVLSDEPVEMDNPSTWEGSWRV